MSLQTSQYPEVFPCLGQSVREPELVLLHQLTAPTVTMYRSGCALLCLTEAVPLVLAVYLTCPYPSARIRSKGYCSTQYTCEVAMRNQQNHLSPWADLGVPIMCLSLVIPDSNFMVYDGDGCSPITNFLFLGWSKSTLDSQSKWTPGGS